MSMSRLVATALLLVALACGAGAATSTATRAPVAAPCTQTSLAEPFTGPLQLSQMARFGCEDGWAFVWATVGTGGREIGVTEVLQFDVVVGRWTFVSRLTHCKPGVLPDYVYRLGCFSN